jgi:hypothetical protein
MKAVITSLILCVIIIYPWELFSQSHLDFDLSISSSISPNLGLSEDTVKLELSIINPNGGILFFRSHSYDYFSVTDHFGRMILSDGDYQKGIQQFKLADSIEHQDFQIKILSGEQILLPIVVSDENTILNENKIKDAFYLFFAGIFVSILLYNLFLFVSLGDVLYLIYVIATIFIGLVQLHFGGKLTEWFYSRQSIFAVYDTQILGALSGVSTIVFANSLAPFSDNMTFAIRLPSLFQLYYSTTYIFLQH